MKSSYICCGKISTPKQIESSAEEAGTTHITACFTYKFYAYIMLLMPNQTFFKAPRYVFRKLNIYRLLDRHKIINGSFIDVGCGAGELACSLAKRGFHGTGADFSKGAVKIGESIRKSYGLSSQDIEFTNENAAELKDTYRLVICCEVLEHVEHDGILLRSLAKLSDEYLLLSVPAKQRLFDESDEAVGHFRRYEKTDFIKLIEGQGLEIVEFMNYGYPFTNAVRLLRKVRFKKIAGRRSMESKTQKSGINPVDPPHWLKPFDLEVLLKPLFWLSLTFNKTNLGEGYLVLARKKVGND